MFSVRRPLSASLARCASAAAVCAALLAAVAPSASAAPLNWDFDGDGANGLGGTGVWNTTDLRWFDTAYTMWPSLLSAASTTTAVFQGTPGKVSLGEPITANGLLFSVNGYTVDNGGTAANTLTLAGTAPALTVTRGADAATISAVVAGSAGWTKLGRGSLYLTNTGNSYTGTTTISSGNVVVSDSRALGLDSSAVVVNGSSTRGAGGGALVLEGEAAGFSVSRGLSLAGGGLNNDGAALFTTGNVTVTGPVTTTPTGAASTRIYSAFGTLKLGDVAVGGTAGSTITSFGGFGSVAINGVLAGTGTIEKAGPLPGVAGGTLILNPSSSSSFSGSVRVTSGSVRVSSPGALGTNTATGTASAIDLKGGLVGALEVRADAVASNQVVFHSSVYDNAGGIVFLDHAVGSSGINTTAVFDSLAYNSGQDVTFNGRNGYGVTFNAVNSLGGNTGNSTLTFNLNGLATIIGDYTGVLNFSGNGDGLITGNLNIGGATQGVKTGSGTLTVQGSASTMTNFAVTGSGVLAINYLGALNNSAGTILQLGTSNAANIGAGTLNYLGEPGTGAGGTFLKTISMAGTNSGSFASILANQSGTAPTPLIIAGPFTSGAVSKSFILGGSSTLNNEVSGVIVDNSAANTTSVLKTGTGTWVLSGANTYTGSTGISSGTLKAQANAAASTVIADASALNFVTNATTQTAAGTFELVGQANTNNVESIGVLNTLGGAGTVVVTPGLNGTATLNIASINPVFNATTTAASSASTTVTVPTTGLFAGQGIYGTGVASNSTISSITSGTALVANVAQTIANTTPLTFTRPTGTSVNFVPAAGGSVVVGSVPAAGLVGGYAYFGGADFAYAPSATNATLRAPIYDGSDAGFITAGAALSDNVGTNQLMTASAVTNTGNLLSLKIAGSQTLTINSSQVLTINTGTNTPGGLLVTGGSATITGGAGLTTAGQGDLVIRVNGATDELLLSTPVTSTTTGGLTKTGAGTLIVNALNNQSGLTYILEGTIKLTGTAATSRLSAVTQGLVIRQGGTFDLNGVTMANSVLTSLNGAGTITNSGSTPATFFMGASGGGGTFTGVLQDGPTSTLGFGKTSGSGTGTVNLNGLSTYTGPTLIGSTGALATPILTDIGQPSGIGKGVATDDASNAASLVFSAGTSGALAYTGSTSIGINRLFTLAATATGGGGQIANNSPNNSALIYNNPGAVRFNSTFTQLLTLGGTSTGDSQFFPKISNNGALTTGLIKSGSGVWVLSNQTNDYTGTTTIGIASTTTPAGTLRVVGTSLPANSPLAFNANTTATGGVLEMSGSFTRPIAATAVAGASTVTWLTGSSIGGGFAASDSKLTVALGGLANPTALTWGSGGFMTGTGALLLGSATALSEVEFTNAINLGASVRGIIVTDNTDTFTDYSTVSGVLSGTGGITKGGAGMLHLTALNTYTGTTAVTNGTLVVSSLGDSTVAGSLSNLGAASSALTSGLLLGNASTAGGALLYVGHGESTDRAIQLNTTTGSTLLYADGTGPLVLRNVQNSAGITGAKILALRGASTFANEITSNLSNDGGGGVLSILHDAPGTWILSGNNNFSGTVTNSLGSLGLGSDTGFGTATLALSSVGTYFAANGDRTLANAVTLAGGGNAMFVGDNSLTLTGAFSDSASTTSSTITNNIGNGKSLFLNGTMTRTAVSNTTSLQLAGTGSTVVNGAVMQTTGGTYSIAVQGPGTVIVNTAQTYNGATSVNGGTLIYGIDQATPNTGTMTIGNQAGATAVLDLNGHNATFPALTFNGASASSTTSATVRTGAGTLTLGGTVTYTATGNPLGARLDGNVALGATRTFAINDSSNAPVDLTVGAVISGPTFGITKTGLGTLRLSAANTYTGPTLINNGVVQYGINDAINAASAVSVIAAGAGLTATLDLNNFNGTLNSLTLGGGTGATPTSTANVQTGTGTLTLGGNVTYSNTGSPLGSTISGNLDLGAATRTFTIGDSANAPVDLTVDANVIAASGVGIVKAGSGLLAFNKSLTLTGAAGFQNTAGTTNLGGAANSIAGDLALTAGTVNLTSLSNIVSGNLQVGLGGSGTLNFNTAGGTLTVGSGPASGVDFGVSTATGSAATVNLAGSQQFTANVGLFRVGSLSTTTALALSAPVTVTLATNNDITAATSFLLGDNLNGTNAVAQAVSLQFGSGTNKVTTPSFTVGGRKGPPATGAGAVVTIAPGGTLTLNNGAATTDLFIGNSTTATATISSSTMDVSAGTFIATLGNVTVANKLGIGGTSASSTGTLKIGASAQNAITANSVAVANATGGTASIPNDATGTLSFGGGTFTVANNVTLGTLTGIGTSQGTLLLTGGVFTVGGNITTSNATGGISIVTLDGGTLDMTAGTINVDGFNARSGTLKNVQQLQSGDAATAAQLSKVGPGVLVLDGANFYTGLTGIQEGTVVVSGSIAASSGVDIGLGASFIMDGTSTNRVKDDATLNVAGGTVAFTSAVAAPNGLSETVGTLALTNNSVLDFGAHAANTLTLTGAASVDTYTLSIYNWSGSAYAAGATADSGDPLQDRLLFSNLAGTGITPAQLSQISFYSDDGHAFLGYGMQVAGPTAGILEVVPTAIPEPASLALLASAALLGLRRARRRAGK
jgi:autotransporter-associated beta strand protein